MKFFRLNLKNVAVISACFAVTAALTSCQKDGVYHPGKKISKVYSQRPGEGKELDEIYKWDGNKLDKVTNADGSWFMKFSYDGNRVSKITDNDGDYTVTFSYSGSKYDKIELVAKGYNVVWKPTYKGSNIIKIERTETYLGSKSNAELQEKAAILAAVELFLPVPIRENENEAILKSAQKERKAGNVSVETYTYTWKGSNITKMEHEWTSSYDSKVYTSTTDYKEYDKKKNPFYGYVDEDMISSKNNCLKEEYTSSGGSVAEYEYEYIYKGSYPTECTTTYTSGSYKGKYITIYEYE